MIMPLYKGSLATVLVNNGQIVYYKWPMKSGESTSPSYPAIVYKTYSGADAEHGFVGLYVFSDEGIKHYKKVPHHPTGEQCWRLHE